MRFTNECIRLCWLSCLIFLGAQACAQSLTVNDAVEAAKKKKSEQAVTSVQAMPSALLTPLNNQLQPAYQPQLWSIKGINGEYTAEIIYEQKIYPLKLVMGTHFQKWEIIDFDSESVSLLEKKSTSQKSKALIPHKSSTQKPLKLFVAPRGNSISHYRISVESEINTMPRQAASNLPMQPSFQVKN